MSGLGKMVWKPWIPQERPHHLISNCRQTLAPPQCYANNDVEACDIQDEDCFTISFKLQQSKFALEKAVQHEDFPLAQELHQTSLALSLALRMVTIAQLRGNIQHAVASCVCHKFFGYRGLIIGYDPTCLAEPQWRDQNRVELLLHGANQPFYHVLVDTRDRLDSSGSSLITYCAQENLVAARTQSIRHPKIDEYVEVLRAEDGKSWSYIPKPELREIYKDDF